MSQAAELILHQGDVNLDLGHPKLDLSVRDIKVDGKWIEGEIIVDADVFGRRLHTVQPFKTENSVDTDIPLIAGASLSLHAYMEGPKRVCASGTLNWGPVKIHVPNKCTNF